MPTGECAFCRIVAGLTPAEILLADGDVVAFLDHRPLFHGHCLVVPRAHHETLADLPERLVAALFARVRALTRAVEAATRAEGSFVAINNRVSQSVPHLHVHIVPRRKGDGLKGFFWPRTRYRDAAHAAETAESIRAALNRVDHR
ncbi:MAG TPA: HIT family protein [Chloroflexota bacterium]|jgi:histidine triad (HIT) family protein